MKLSKLSYLIKYEHTRNDETSWNPVRSGWSRSHIYQHHDAYEIFFYVFSHGNPILSTLYVTQGPKFFMQKLIMATLFFKPIKHFTFLLTARDI